MDFGHCGSGWKCYLQVSQLLDDLVCHRCVTRVNVKARIRGRERQKAGDTGELILRGIAKGQHNDSSLQSTMVIR